MKYMGNFLSYEHVFSCFVNDGRGSLKTRMIAFKDDFIALGVKLDLSVDNFLLF